MCGIAGFSWRDERLVKAMTDALRHRGPDDEGFYADEHVSLGHRRLAIIDLSALGHQPMMYELGGRRVIVTFNGEIFNFREIRRTLAARCYPFHTGSDTEIILAAYLEWGSECVQQFNGMWAFALYEPAARRLFLSRDRFGEKPLHYHMADGRLIFASEIKAILAHPIARRANRDVVSDYLYRAEANGRLDSFFDGIMMLPPAHNAVFELDAHRLTLRRYYEPRRGNRRVAPDEFRATLRKSVERRLVSDVPISISLSSGTDSTSVAALTAQLASTTRIKAFTTTSVQGVGDETALISHFLARYPQFDLEKSDLSEASFCERYREIIYHMDEPFARQSAYVRWEIAHLTATHRRKVLLNGEGADEVLGGYASFAPPFLRDLLKHGKLFRLGRELGFTFTHPERDRIFHGLRENSASKSSRNGEKAVAGALRRKFGIRVDWTERPPQKYDDIKDLLHAWVHESSLPRLLVCNDKMAMANSVEGRAPFLDHEFVDMAFSMDPADFLFHGYRKHPLRQAMQGLVPDEILFRKAKDAFHAPMFEYLRSEPIQRRIEEIFSEPRTAAVLDPRAYLSEYGRFLARQHADRPFLLHALFLEEWARMFEVEFS